MSYTFNDYVTKIKQLVPISENFPDSYFITAINQARLEIASFFDPLISYSTFILDSNEVDITTKTGYSYDEILKILSVVIKQSNLRYEIVRRYKEDIPFENIIGYPIFYYLIGKKLGFYPQPTSDLYCELKISLKPSLLSTGQTDTFFTENYTLLITLLACSYISLMGGNANLGTYFRQLYEDRKGIVSRTRL